MLGIDKAYLQHHVQAWWVIRVQHSTQWNSFSPILLLRQKAEEQAWLQPEVSRRASWARQLTTTVHIPVEYNRITYNVSFLITIFVRLSQLSDIIFNFLCTISVIKLITHIVHSNLQICKSIVSEGCYNRSWDLKMIDESDKRKVMIPVPRQRYVGWRSTGSVHWWCWWTTARNHSSWSLQSQRCQECQSPTAPNH